MPKSSIEQYQEFQDYTNYIDTSDVMLDFYKNQEGMGLEKYYLMIEEWLSMEQEDPQKNQPLVIQGDGGVGKKTLLVKWFQYHQSLKTNRKKDLTILHFATTGGNNSNYFYAIYRILIKLREELNIGQKVQLHEEKIRKYFSYWLDVCNQRIENQAIQNLQTIYQKIILVFEGIDYFLDRGTGKEGNIAFWLPKYFPKNVKVIVTADGESESMKYFNNLECQKVDIPSDITVAKNMIRWQTEKELCISVALRDKILSILEMNIKVRNVTSLYVKSYLSCFLPEKLKEIDLSQESLSFLQKAMENLDFEKLKELKTIQDLFDYLLEFWGCSLLVSEEKFKELIGILISTQKGLTLLEIISTTKISQEELKLFITLFRSFLMNFKDLWMIKNDSFKKSINNKYEFKITEISEKIADSLKRTPNSVRKLEEETFQLYTAGNYFKLKEVISDIQNFLLLFNPYTKYDLCKYWQKLQEKSFDPVIEYNKAIQGFEMHYHPTSDDLFRIITQISRFLKQFSDFETYYTPQFRHPKLIGNSNQLCDIGILGEFKNLQLCSQDKQDLKNEEKIIYEEDNSGTNENEEEKKLKKKIKEMYEKIDQGKHIKKINKIEIEAPPPTIPSKKQGKEGKDKNEEKKPQKKKKQRFMTIQQLNVEVKSNQEQFRKHYYEDIKPFLQKYSLDGEKETYLQDTEKDEDYEDSDKEESQSANLVAKIKNIEKEKQKEKAKAEELPDLKQLYAKTVEEEFQLNQKPPTNYYYKRWIWMQFPWVCMTMKCDYSDKLRKCFTSPTSYMSVSEERQFTLQALKIALQAKRKKQAILEKTQEMKPKKKKEGLGPLQVNSATKYQSKDNTNNGTKFQESLMTSKTKQKKRMDELGFVTSSFLSLNNLSKQLENIHYSKNQKLDMTENDERNSLFITAEDKTFEEYSSLLHSMNKKKKKQLFTEQDLNVTKKSRQGILPRIKQNVNKEMLQELEELEKNNSSMRKQVDTYLYKNKVLAKRLKQLKIIQQNNNNEVKNERKICETKSRISELESKIEKVKYQYAYSLLQHERLNVLIKICQKNKTQNEQAIPDLVLECNNFKKMINLENQTINELNKKIEELKKLTKKFLLNCYEKVKNQTTLNEQIQQTLKNREQFHDEVEKYDELILEEIDEKRRQLNEKARSIHLQSQQQKQMDKTKKSGFNEDEENYHEIFNQIMQHLDLQENNYQEDPKYIELLDGLNKKKELEVIIEERKVQLEELEKKYKQEKRQLQTIEKADEDVDERRKQQQLWEAKYENLTEEHESEEALEKKLHEKQRVLNKITDVKLSCLGMLNTWYNRMGLPEQTELVITPEFLQKVQEVKVLHKIENC